MYNVYKYILYIHYIYSLQILVSTSGIVIQYRMRLSISKAPGNKLF